MPSPFPGMDPYLEEENRWPEVHGTLIVLMRSAINTSLPARYTAHIDRYVWLEETESETRTRKRARDVYVTENGSPSTSAPGTATLAAPAIVTLPALRRNGPRYIRIVDRDRQRLVTVIEILSPANKAAGPDRDAYMTKRNEYLATHTNLIEIDLLRAGRRLPLGHPALPASHYCILISLAAQFPQAGVWPFSVRDPIPLIHVPLANDDPPIPVDLKPCLERAYADGRYYKEIDYSKPPVPPLRKPDATWARQLLAGQAPSGDPS